MGEANSKEGRVILTVTFDKHVEDVTSEVVWWRRHLHRNPELSFHEEETAQFVYETLRSFGNSLELSRPTPTSVVARLIGAKPGRTLAIRADMDALLATRGAAAKETPEASAWEGRDREADQQPAGRSEA